MSGLVHSLTGTRLGMYGELRSGKDIVSMIVILAYQGRE
jgi:hypothetical protein